MIREIRGLIIFKSLSFIPSLIAVSPDARRSSWGTESSQHHSSKMILSKMILSKFFHAKEMRVLGQ